MREELIDAHFHSGQHREEVLASDVAGCFYCLDMFNPSTISEWIDDGETALCPHCNVDSVIGAKSGHPINRDFLREVRDHWFVVE